MRGQLALLSFLLPYKWRCCVSNHYSESNWCVSVLSNTSINHSVVVAATVNLLWVLTAFIYLFRILGGTKLDCLLGDVAVPSALVHRSPVYVTHRLNSFKEQPIPRNYSLVLMPLTYAHVLMPMLLSLFGPCCRARCSRWEQMPQWPNPSREPEDLLPFGSRGKMCRWCLQ